MKKQYFEIITENIILKPSNVFNVLSHVYGLEEIKKVKKIKTCANVSTIQHCCNNINNGKIVIADGTQGMKRGT